MHDFAEWPAPAKALVGLFALLLLAVLWSVLASLFFLLGTNMLTGETLPLFQFWQYLHFYGFAHPVVGLWLKIAAGAATAVPVLLFLGRIARKGLLGTLQRELHGETRWAKRGELVKAGFYTKFAGLYVGQG
jgi:type IV secretion system protein VirD4